MIPVSLAIAICNRLDRQFADFFLAAPTAILICDAMVDTVAFAQWVGLSSLEGA